MSLYDEFVIAATNNLAEANTTVKTTGNGDNANYLVQFAQVQAMLAIAEAIRNPRSKPSSGGPG